MPGARGHRHKNAAGKMVGTVSRISRMRRPTLMRRNQRRIRKGL